MRTPQHLIHALLAAGFVLGLAATPAFAMDDKMKDSNAGMSDTSMEHKNTGTGMKNEMKSGGMSSHSDMSKKTTMDKNGMMSKDKMKTDQ